VAKAPIVLLPGMMLDGRMWQDQWKELGEHASLYLGDVTSSETIPCIARDVLLPAPDCFHVVAFSLGAIVALELWRQAPKRIISLVLIGLNPRSDPEERRTVRLAQMQRAIDGELEALMQEVFLPRYFAGDTPPPGLTETVLDMALRLGPDVFCRQTRAQLTRPDSLDTLTTINVPTLAICGSDDRITAVSQHESIRERLSGAKLEVIAGAGHMVTMEQPKAVTETLKDFFREMHD